MASVEVNEVPFPGTARFQLKRLLGGGAMGIVYEAHDRERNETVALKVMRHMDPTALQRFKQEFRGLADISHPNLVSLYELLSEEGRWFFTMQLVTGVGFMEWVRRRDGEESTASLDQSGSLQTVDGILASSPDQPTTDLPASALRSQVAQVAAGPVTSRGTLLERRLRAALRQLAEGLHALHRAHRLHRDLKPSNILVTPLGRVLLCDFGLVHELGGADESDGHVVGTVNYMSPEQASGRRLSTASDWYSVGVILYVALTGRLPFSGAEGAVLHLKQRQDPVRARDLVPNLPQDLEQLCHDLLERDPQRRPSGPEILARLGCDVAELALDDSQSQFVGREEALRELHDCLDAARKGAGGLLMVSGRSGFGKSALVSRFLADVGQVGAVVLQGRCYERESVPYKGFDAAMDRLTMVLLGLEPEERARVLPPGSAALARLFPVFERALASEGARPEDETAAVLEPRELRRVAFGAFREMLRALARDQRVVLYIDDLQWADLDSGELLVELLRGPAAPPILILTSHREEEEETSPLLQHLIGQKRLLRELAEVRRLSVGPLSEGDSRRLASALGGDSRVVEHHAERIAREAGGNPLFVRELVRYVKDGAGLDSGNAHLDLGEVLGARIARLPVEARAVLSLVAVAGQPVPQGVVLHSVVAGVSFRELFELLRAEHLVRTSGARDSDTVEVYHDRIRRVMVAGLTPTALRQHHERLALALERMPGTDPEQLVDHWLGAENHEAAARHAASAALRARDALAFDRAARLYRTAIDLGTWTPVDRRQLRLGYADALANAGRGAQAAEVYLAAREDAAGPDEVIVLERIAAEKLLQSGHLEQGTKLLVQVLEEAGESFPKTQARAFARLLATRARLSLRGIGFVRRHESEIPPRTLARLDVLHAAGTGFANLDPVRGLAFEARHTFLALESGEPSRIALGLASEAALSGTNGARAYDRSLRVGKRALEIAEGIRNHRCMVVAHGALAIVEFLSGYWKAALRRCLSAQRILRSKVTGAQWETDTIDFYWLGSMFYLGELGRLGRLVPERIRDAEERGDLLGLLAFQVWRNHVTLITHGDLEGARREVAEVRKHATTGQGFQVQHFYIELISEVQNSLYAGDVRGAWNQVERMWPALDRSFLLRVQNIRVESYQLRGRVALATGDRKLLDVAARDARRLAGEKRPWARALGKLLEAGVACARGDRAVAAARLRDAIVLSKESEMGLYVAVAQHRLAEVVDGEEGAAVRTAAREWFAGEGIAHPERVVALVAPGFGKESGS